MSSQVRRWRERPPARPWACFDRRATAFSPFSPRCSTDLCRPCRFPMLDPQLRGMAGSGVLARPAAAASRLHTVPPTSASADERQRPHFPRHGSHQHAPPPANAVPERRPATLRPGQSATLRSLAHGTVGLPRTQMEERFGAAFAETAAAVEQAAEGRVGPAGLSALARLPSLPRSLARQLAAARRRQRQDGGATQDETPLSHDALTLVLLATAVSFICSIDRAAMSVAVSRGAP